MADKQKADASVFVPTPMPKHWTGRFDHRSIAKEREREMRKMEASDAMQREKEAAEAADDEKHEKEAAEIAEAQKVIDAQKAAEAPNPKHKRNPLPSI